MSFTATELWDFVDSKDLNNPFHRLGTDDAKRIGQDFPIARVGLVEAARKAVAPHDVFDFRFSLHILLVAPYGGGKSATIRRLARGCKDSGGAAAVVKLDQQRIQNVLAEVDAEACANAIVDDVVAEFAESLAKKKNPDVPFAERKREARGKLQHSLQDVNVPRLFAQLALKMKELGVSGGLVLLDEVEALLVAEIPLPRRLQLLDVLKNWCEETDAHLSLVLAGTNAVLDLIRERAPKVLDGRLTPITDFNLDVDDVSEYLSAKMTYAGGYPDLIDLLEPDAVEWIASASRGVPRRLERLCHAAWSSARQIGSFIGRVKLREAIAGLAGSQIESRITSAGLPRVEKTAARKLARYGLSSQLCRDEFTASEFRALYRLFKRDLELPIVSRRDRGVYEISDELLRDAFDGGD